MATSDNSARDFARRGAGTYLQNLANSALLNAHVFHHGICTQFVRQRVQLGDTIAHLEQAARQGRGVVVASAHFFAYEAAFAISCRQISSRGAIVVRETLFAKHRQTKLQWYEQALGAQLLWRPSSASRVAETRRYVRTIRDGATVLITPDLVVPSGQGIRVSLLGRQLHLPVGSVGLAQAAGAPLVWMFVTGTDGGMEVRFHEPLDVPRQNRRHWQETVLQSWCDAFEHHIRARPGDWMFWLDKRWTRAFRVARDELEIPGAESIAQNRESAAA